MDVITKTPGLQHISEDILKLLKTKGLMNCRLVNTSWKNVMNQSTFWLSKMKRQDITEDIQRSWKMLAQDLSNDQLSNSRIFLVYKLPQLFYNFSNQNSHNLALCKSQKQNGKHFQSYCFSCIFFNHFAGV